MSPKNILDYFSDSEIVNDKEFILYIFQEKNNFILFSREKYVKQLSKWIGVDIYGEKILV